mmetsp:Transcript_25476/g.79775  ORF Transcript_25476/g.79775 Transcript_25476/m.79775 type:complete len:211 (+) Transcript_25476:673-1305(+)
MSRSTSSGDGAISASGLGSAASFVPRSMCLSTWKLWWAPRSSTSRTCRQAGLSDEPSPGARHRSHSSPSALAVMLSGGGEPPLVGVIPSSASRSPAPSALGVNFNPRNAASAAGTPVPISAVYSLSFRTHSDWRMPSRTRSGASSSASATSSTSAASSQGASSASASASPGSTLAAGASSPGVSGTRAPFKTLTMPAISAAAMAFAIHAA